LIHPEEAAPEFGEVTALEAATMTWTGPLLQPQLANGIPVPAAPGSVSGTGKRLGNCSADGAFTTGPALDAARPAQHNKIYSRSNGDITKDRGASERSSPPLMRASLARMR
jgi:hypothetical protein